ncbi:MAG: UPF0182 family protein [Acidimicrobiia bacterium]|nr:UPF0182 family protein [Acidimicrobiia bacterium]
MRSPDVPRRRVRTTRGRVGLLVAAAVIFIVIISLRGIAGFYTDYLWFQELHLTSVWRGVLGAKVGLATLFTIVFFALMWVNLAIADRIAPAFRPMGPEEELVERYHQVVGPRQLLVRTAVSALFALIAGPSVAGHWNQWILFTHHVPFGVKDPQFHRDVGFFVFQLPFLKFLVDWLFASTIIILIVTAVAHYLNGGIRVQAIQKVTPQVKAHLSVLLGILALLKAAGYYLQRYELNFSTRGVVQGASYTDVKAQLPALQLLIFISLFAFALLIYNIWRRGWTLPIIAVGLWAFVSIIIGAAYPAFIQQFRVSPTESKKERPYIARNIRATRAAYNLTNIQTNPFDFNTNLTAGDLANNAQTIRNVRLWDPDVLRTTYQQLQEIRGFYRFNDVDVDRYMIDNNETQVELSARDLNPAGIPSPSWVNTHLVYTHGYGSVLSPANAVVSGGDPQLLVKDLPPQSSQGAPTLDRPGLYYGENLGGYSIVNTDQKEIDFTEANGTNHQSTYAGTGGVRLNSIFKRAALSLRFGDFNPLISGFINGKSRIIYIRDIRDRVRKAAPFLKYDDDPYPVILNGKLYWIQDAYTTTNNYPYAQKGNTERLSGTSGLNTSFNYVRNSVKAVTDAFNGTVTFYVVDNTDPMIKAYQKAFPKLFTDGSQISPELRAHLRYPEDLFRVQTNMFGLYHITDPAAFYNKSDAWDISQDPGSGQVGAGGAITQTTNAQGVVTSSREARMNPYYLLMKLPNEPTESFMILQPFVPVSQSDQRKNLSAFMIAKSDPSDYGKMETFVMPGDVSVDGPALADAKINQDTTISSQITLLNTAGSKVLLGNMLVVPVNQSLLYIRPLYVQAVNTPQPQFKKAIVVYGGRAVMQDTLKDALQSLFGAAPPTQEQVANGGPAPAPSPPSTPAPPSSQNPNQKALLDQAAQALNDAQTALHNGDLAGYQNDVNNAQKLIQQAQAQQSTGGGVSNPQPSGSPPTTTQRA